MTKGSERSLVDTARVLCHRPVKHAARHYDVIRAVEMDTVKPAAAEPEPACSPCVDVLTTAQDYPIVDAPSNTLADEDVLTRAAKRQKRAPALRIEDAVSVVVMCAAMVALRNTGDATEQQRIPLH
jgi:hypothetical protein